MPDKTTTHFLARKRLIAAAISACFVSAPAWSNPRAPQVVNGSASFNQSGNLLTVTNTNGTIINWNSFSIGANETTRFNQASASSSVLNRVLASDPSVLLGTLSSNGHVWLVNPAGIMVGQGARIDVAGFVASTLNVRNEDFLAGRLNFGTTPNAGSIQNYGQITTPSGGSVYLVAPAVTNNGIINAPNGEVILAAGQTVQLVDTGTPGVSVAITGAAGDVTNLGKIVSEAGQIGMAGVLVKNNGTLDASSVVKEGGRIFLRASQDAYVDGAGRIVATGTKGGSIDVLGNRVAVTDQAQLDASGSLEGGQVLVGGDYQGKNPDVQNANVTYVGPQTSISANATANGNGGKVIVWADDTTRAHGTISAKGGAQSGNGGLIETSGHQFLDVAGITVDTSAAKGTAGNWLLDPNDVNIVHYGGPLDSQISPSSPFAPTQTDSSVSTLSDYTINQGLAGGNVTITTSSGGSGSGDITVNGTSDSGGAVAIVNSGGAHSISLIADRNILMNSGASISGSAGNPLSVTFNSNAGISGYGNIQMFSGSSITTYGGNVVMGGGANPLTGYAQGSGSSQASASGIYIEGDINTGAGNVTMHGTGAVGFVPGDGVALVGGTLTSDGSVNIDGIAQASHAYGGCLGICDFVAGVHFANAGVRLTTATGTVNVTGSNSVAGTRAQGVTIDAATVETTGSGTLTFNGASNTSNTSPDTNWGVGIVGGTVRTTATGGGNLTFNGAAPFGDGAVVVSGGNVISFGGEIRMLSPTSGGIGFAGGDVVGGANSGNILMKVSGDTSSIDVGFSGASSINAGSSALTLSLAGGIASDNGVSTISAGSLRLLGTGDYHLSGPNNNVGTLAGNVSGTVNYSNTGTLNIGSVTSFDGDASTTTAGLTAGNGASVTAGVDLALGNSVVSTGGDLSLTASSGAIKSTMPFASTQITTNGGYANLSGANGVRVAAIDTTSNSNGSGNVDISSDGDIATGSITTKALNSGQGAGSVLLQTSMAAITVTGTIDASGANGDSEYNSGSGGGNVDLIRTGMTAPSGGTAVQMTGNILTYGGNGAAGTGGDGGEGGYVNIASARGYCCSPSANALIGDITVGGKIDAHGGTGDGTSSSWGGSGGYGGYAYIAGNGAVKLGATLAAGATTIDTAGGDAGNSAIGYSAYSGGGQGGAVTVQGTSILINGSIDAHGGRGADGGKGYGYGGGSAGGSGGTVQIGADSSHVYFYDAVPDENVTTSEVHVYGAIDTSGGDGGKGLVDDGYSGAGNGGGGGVGGSVRLVAAGPVSIDKSVSTYGGIGGYGGAAVTSVYGGGIGGYGGGGGSVDVYGGGVSIGGISAYGGAGGMGGNGTVDHQGGNGGSGGNGNSVYISSSGDISVGGPIDTHGGQAGDGGAYGGSGGYNGYCYGECYSYGNAGDVTLDAGGAVSFNSVVATGGSGGSGMAGGGVFSGGSGGDGGTGGSVDMTATSISIVSGGTGTISTYGGNGGYGGASDSWTGAGGNAGYGGYVYLDVSGGAVNTGDIDTHGGDGGNAGVGALGLYGGDGGWGGSVEIDNTSSITTGAITTRGGKGGHGGGDDSNSNYNQYTDNPHYGAGWGGDGGGIDLQSTGTVGVGAIGASGGNGGASGLAPDGNIYSAGSGGNGGNAAYDYWYDSVYHVTINGSSIVIGGGTGTITARGGAGGAGSVGYYGGVGGDGDYAHLSTEGAVASGAIYTTGGAGGVGEAGDGNPGSDNNWEIHADTITLAASDLGFFTNGTVNASSAFEFDPINTPSLLITPAIFTQLYGIPTVKFGNGTTTANLTLSGTIDLKSNSNTTLGLVTSGALAQQDSAPGAGDAALAVTNLYAQGGSVSLGGGSLENNVVNLQGKATSGNFVFSNATSLNIAAGLLDPTVTTGIIATGNASLFAGGTLTQSAPLILPGTLTTSSSGGQTLNGANAIGSFNATNAASGNIALASTGGLTLAAISNAGGGSITVSNAGPIGITGTVAAAGGGAINLVATGAITESGGGLLSTSGTLTTSSMTGQTLNGANAVGTVNAVNTTSGDVALTNSAALTIAGINNGGGDLSVTNGGTISITGPITMDGGGAVSLTATGASGAIAESGAGTINTTGALVTSSTGGQTLGGVNNPSGRIDMTAGGPLTLWGSGNLILGAINAGANPVVIKAGGAILQAPGTGSSTNIIASSADLSSIFGGASGDLAISSNTQITGALTATVGTGADFGGIRIKNTGAQPTSVTLTDNALAGASVSFLNTGDITSTSGFTLKTLTGGDLALLSNGNITWDGGSLATPSDSVQISADGSLGVTGALSSPVDLALSSNVAISISGSVVTGGTGTASFTAPSLAINGSVNSADDVGIIADTLTLGAGSSTGAAHDVIIAASNVTATNATVSADHDISAAVTGDMRFNASGFTAGNDIFIKMLGATSTLYLNDATGLARAFIWAQAPSTIHLAFPARDSGGMVVDGVAVDPLKFVPTSGGSGLFYGAAMLPATPGAGLELAYGIATPGAPNTVAPTLFDAVIAAITASTTKVTGPVLPGTFGGGLGLGGSNGTLGSDQTIGGDEGHFGGKDEEDENKTDESTGLKKDADKPTIKKLSTCS